MWDRKPFASLQEVSEQLQVNQAWQSDVGLMYGFAQNGFMKECNDRIRSKAEQNLSFKAADEYLHLYKIGQLEVEKPLLDDKTVQAFYVQMMESLSRNPKDSTNLHVYGMAARDLIFEARTKAAINNITDIPKDKVK